MNRFAQLLDRLAYEPGRNNKLRLITSYFREVEDPDRGYALAALTGARSFRHAKPALIRDLIAARTDPEAKGSRGISLFIVEKGNPGLKVARQFEKHGWRSSDTAELFFEDMAVPEEALLGEEGKGFYYIMGTFQNERLVVGGAGRLGGQDLGGVLEQLQHRRRPLLHALVVGDLLGAQRRRDLVDRRPHPFPPSLYAGNEHHRWSAADVDHESLSS